MSNSNVIPLPPREASDNPIFRVIEASERWDRMAEQLRRDHAEWMKRLDAAGSPFGGSAA